MGFSGKIAEKPLSCPPPSNRVNSKHAGIHRPFFMIHLLSISGPPNPKLRLHTSMSYPPYHIPWYNYLLILPSYPSLRILPFISSHTLAFISSPHILPTISSSPYHSLQILFSVSCLRMLHPFPHLHNITFLILLHKLLSVSYPVYPPYLTFHIRPSVAYPPYPILHIVVPYPTSIYLGILLSISYRILPRYPHLDTLISTSHHQAPTHLFLCSLTYLPIFSRTHAQAHQNSQKFN